MLRFAFAALLLSTSAQASADVDAKGSAVISELTFSVIDLDPNDGVGAAFWFADANGSRAGYQIGLARTGLPPALGGVVDSNLDSVTNFLVPGAATSSQAGTSSVVSVDAAGIAMSGELTRLGTSFATFARSVTQPFYTGYPYTLWITPHTQLIVSAIASVSASAGTGCDWKPSGLCAGVHAEASLGGRVIRDGIIAEAPTSSLSVDAGLGRFYTYDSRGLPFFVGDENFGPTNAQSGVLSITLTNMTSEASSEYVQLESTVVATAVPEPAAYTLMLSGLLSLAMVVRLGRSNAKQIWGAGKAST